MELLQTWGGTETGVFELVVIWKDGYDCGTCRASCPHVLPSYMKRPPKSWRPNTPEQHEIRVSRHRRVLLVEPPLLPPKCLESSQKDVFPSPAPLPASASWPGGELGFRVFGGPDGGLGLCRALGSGEVAFEEVWARQGPHKWKCLRLRVWISRSTDAGQGLPVPASPSSCEHDRRSSGYFRKLTRAVEGLVPPNNSQHL